jgi:hypothetical protein
MSTTLISDTLRHMMFSGINSADLDWLDLVEREYWLTDEEQDLVDDLKLEYLQWLNTFGGDIK